MVFPTAALEAVGEIACGIGMNVMSKRLDLKDIQRSKYRNLASDTRSSDYKPVFMELLPDNDLDIKGENHLFQVGITLIPKFTLVAFAGFVDALRLSSDIGDRSQPKYCSWALVGPDKHNVTSSCGASVPHTEVFADPSRFDYIVVVGGLISEKDEYDKRLLDYLRRAADAGVTLIGLCTGVFAMAQAGVLDGYRCCVHGYHLSQFQCRFSNIEVTSNQIYLVDRRRITCAGGVAAIDVAAYIIAEQCGLDRARKVLPHILLDELRPPSHSQLSFVDDFFKVQDERVREAVFIMQQHLEDPLPIDAIARTLGVPARQLERGFQRSFSRSPSGFYRIMRLERAKWLLIHSGLNITQIAIDCGFADTSHLTRTFKQQYGELPTTFRNRASQSEKEATETKPVGTVQFGG